MNRRLAFLALGLGLIAIVLSCKTANESTAQGMSQIDLEGQSPTCGMTRLSEEVESLFLAFGLKEGQKEGQNAAVIDVHPLYAKHLAHVFGTVPFSLLLHMFSHDDFRVSYVQDIEKLESKATDGTIIKDEEDRTRALAYVEDVNGKKMMLLKISFSEDALDKSTNRIADGGTKVKEDMSYGLEAFWHLVASKGLYLEPQNQQSTQPRYSLAPSDPSDQHKLAIAFYFLQELRIQPELINESFEDLLPLKEEEMQPIDGYSSYQEYVQDEKNKDAISKAWSNFQNMNDKKLRDSYTDWVFGSMLHAYHCNDQTRDVYFAKESPFSYTGRSLNQFFISPENGFENLSEGFLVEFRKSLEGKEAEASFGLTSAAQTGPVVVQDGLPQPQAAAAFAARRPVAAFLSGVAGRIRYRGGQALRVLGKGVHVAAKTAVGVARRGAVAAQRTRGFFQRVQPVRSVVAFALTGNPRARRYGLVGRRNHRAYVRGCSGTTQLGNHARIFANRSGKSLATQRCNRPARRGIFRSRFR